MSQAAATILVVDDEPLIRWAMVGALEDVGYQVLQAMNSEEALETLRHHDEVDLLFTDVNMPGKMDGLVLAQQVHHDHPAMALIVTSGKSRVSDAAIPEGSRFIAKPYSTEAVTRVVGTLLGQRGVRHLTPVP